MQTSNFFFPAMLIVFVVTIFGCSKNDDTPAYGDMTLRLTDAPGDYLEVNVDLKQILFRYTDDDSLSGWINVPANQGIYNLLDLQNGISAIIADTSAIPVGKISQIRLILGTNNSIMLKDSSLFPLSIPSAYTSGLKIQVNADIKPGLKTDITIDFDAALSVVKEGLEYKLNPVIKLHKILYLAKH